VDNTTGLQTGATHSYEYTVVAGQAFRATLVWSDYAAAAYADPALVNNLNLRVTAPNGTTQYWGNRFSGGWSQTGGVADAVNNVENVYVQSPAAGTWTVQVIGQNVPQGPQPYALVVNGNLSQIALPDLAISKTTEQTEAEPGSVVTYDITIQNSGEITATGVIFTDTLPNELLLSHLSPSCLGGTIILPEGFACRLVAGALPPGDSVAYTLAVSVSQSAAGILTNQVAVGANEADGNTTNNTDAAVVTVGVKSLYLPVVNRRWWTVPPPGTLQSIADAFVLQGYPTENLGNPGSRFEDMWAGYDDYYEPDGKIARSFVQFDLSQIPAHTPIAHATLHLHLTASYDFPDQSRTITIYRLSSAWSEASVTWNGTPGIAEAYGSATVTHGDRRWYDFDVTGLVQGWVNGTWPNYGLAIRGPEHSGADSSWRSFDTREQPGYVPNITITYTAQAAAQASEMAGATLTPGSGGVHILDLLVGEAQPPKLLLRRDAE
jgi:uncharacterized repeat protein (TIGR01451 family)